MKLDIEGYEVFALQGAKATINICRPVMLIEINRGMMESHGVKLDDLMEILDMLHYSAKPLQRDLKITDPQLDVLCHPKPQS